MVARRLTASIVSRVGPCPASAALPQVRGETEATHRGIQIHAYLAAVPTQGEEAALALVSEEHRALAESIDLTRLPLSVKDGDRAEVAFALDLNTGAARELVVTGHRDYGQHPAHVVLGTADVVRVSKNSRLIHLWDYKVEGWESTSEPAASNMQLRTLALMACRAHDCDTAKVTLIHIKTDGTWWAETAALDEFDLTEHLHRLRQVWMDAQLVASQVDSGKVPDVAEGSWCRWCPAKGACPAKTRALAVMAAHPESIEREVQANLTPDRARLAVRTILEAQRVLNEARVRAIAYADEVGGIDMGDGTYWGHGETVSEVVDGKTTVGVLAEFGGAEVAVAAVNEDSSKAAIERACRVWQEKERKEGRKVTLKALREKVLAEVKARGGLREKLGKRLGIHRREQGKASDAVVDVPGEAA